jgi:hypothetical protein
MLTLAKKIGKITYENHVFQLMSFNPRGINFDLLRRALANLTKPQIVAW